MSEGRVLVFPRSLLARCGPFLPAECWDDLIKKVDGSHQWLDRTIAETSTLFVQAIPSAIIGDGGGRYLLLRRVPGDRSDLSYRWSLVVGGHIDAEDSVDMRTNGTNFASLIVAALARELMEEVGLRTLSSLLPAGIVVDNTSVTSSRHVAFVYQVKPTEKLHMAAIDEFLLPAKGKARFRPRTDLSRLRDRLDPWSRILLDCYLPDVDHVAGEGAASGAQEGIDTCCHHNRKPPRP